MNQVFFIRGLIKDVKLKQGNKGPYTKIIIAVDRPGKDKETDFPRIPVFGS